MEECKTCKEMKPLEQISKKAICIDKGKLHFAHFCKDCEKNFWDKVNKRILEEEIKRAKQ